VKRFFHLAIDTVTLATQSVHHLPAQTLEDADATRQLYMFVNDSAVHVMSNVLQTLL